jgi:hypothetical protein
MAPLKNPRHEAFVRGLLEGKSATDAHEHAGFVRDDGNASRLRVNPRIQARLAELQAEIVADTKITTASLLGELEDARKKATDLEQLSAAVRAIESKAKLSGLMVEKRQIEVGGPGSFDHMTDPREIALAVVDAVLQYQFQPYDDYRHEDRERLAEQYFACHLAFDEAKERLIKEVAARPRKSGYALPKALPSPHSNSKSRY